jgi:hypothetical protein
MMELCERCNVCSGKVGQAFSFDGVDDYLVIPHSPDLNSTTITVDAWIKPLQA